VAGQTVLSHKQTTDLWHETTHQDPDAYFSLWGYDMNQFNALISSYYNNLKTYGNVYGKNPNIVRVRNNNGSYVPIVSFNNSGSITPNNNRALANNTAWYTDQKKDINGATYDRVATNEWVSDSYSY